jgi:hypothetical protein
MHDADEDLAGQRAELITLVRRQGFERAPEGLRPRSTDRLGAGATGGGDGDRGGSGVVTRGPLNQSEALQPVDEPNRSRRGETQDLRDLVDPRVDEEVQKSRERDRVALGPTGSGGDRAPDPIGNRQRERAEQVRGLLGAPARGQRLSRRRSQG